MTNYHVFYGSTYVVLITQTEGVVWFLPGYWMKQLVFRSTFTYPKCLRLLNWDLWAYGPGRTNSWAIEDKTLAFSFSFSAAPSHFQFPLFYRCLLIDDNTMYAPEQKIVCFTGCLLIIGLWASQEEGSAIEDKTLAFSFSFSAAPSHFQFRSAMEDRRLREIRLTLKHPIFSQTRRIIPQLFNDRWKRLNKTFKKTFKKNVFKRFKRFLGLLNGLV